MEVPAKEITPVDTTSCAGFIDGISRGLSFREAMIAATETAAQVAQGAETLGALKKRDRPHER